MTFLFVDLDPFMVKLFGEDDGFVIGVQNEAQSPKTDMYLKGIQIPADSNSFVNVDTVHVRAS